MRNGAPRHLEAPRHLRRPWTLWTGVGVAVLLVLGGVVWSGTMTGSRPDADRQPAAAPPATASRPAGAVTTTTGAVPTTVAQPSGDGPPNLLPNASFERGSAGWRSIGGARLLRMAGGTAGGWSLRILAGPSTDGPVGVTVPNVTTTKAKGRYHTNAFVRPSVSGTTVTIGLREYVNGRPVPGSNTLGWTVEGTGWRQFGAIHPTAVAGSRLGLEIMARDLPPGGFLDVDEVVLHLLGSRS
jgi:hypothetical protein